MIGPHFFYHANAEAFDLIESIDKSLMKIEKQLNKKVDKWKSRRKEIKPRDLKILDPEEAWTDYDEDSFDDAM